MAWLMGWLSGTRSGNTDNREKDGGKKSGRQSGRAGKDANHKPSPYLKSKPGKARKSRAGGNSKGSHNKAAHPNRPSPYRAVNIHPGTNGCDAAVRIKHQRFLATFAPQLPLGGCDHPQQCKCRYKYHLDRRAGLRRDSDHGLPGAAFHATDRRFRRDRRHRSRD